MSMVQRFNPYRVMWLLVMFDLPTDTAAQRKAAAKFRKQLLEQGYEFMQFSVYYKLCGSMARCTMYQQMLKEILPEQGYVNTIPITDKQFGLSRRFTGKREYHRKVHSDQLELF